MNSHDEYNIGNSDVQLAANALVNAAVYYASPEVPNEQQLAEIRTLVQRQLSELLISIRREVTEAQSVEPRTMSPAELAKQWGIKVDKVLGWIHSGKLEAINVATTQSGRPRFRINADAIAKFKASRTKTIAPPAPARRRAADKNVIAYF